MRAITSRAMFTLRTMENSSKGMKKKSVYFLIAPFHRSTIKVELIVIIDHFLSKLGLPLDIRNVKMLVAY